MKLPVAVFAWCLAALMPLFASAAPVSAPLAILVRGDGAQATKLPAYDPSIPVAVTVTSTDLRLDAMTVVAAGPAGEAIRLPLSRAADGSFRGSLALADPGAWNLRLTSRAGTISTETTPVTLDVQNPPPSNAWQIGFAVGAAMFIVIGVGGFVLLRRIVHSEAPQLENAA